MKEIQTVKKGPGRPQVDLPSQKRSICIYLKSDMYNRIQKHHADTYIPISKVVELALEKYFG